MRKEFEFIQKITSPPTLSLDSEYQFLDFLPFSERTANCDVVFNLKMGCPIQVNLNFIYQCSRHFGRR